MQNELYHHGIKGMRWGVRRYQNKDGSLTHQGKALYAKGKTITDNERKMQMIETGIVAGASIVNYGIRQYGNVKMANISTATIAAGGTLVNACLYAKNKSENSKLRAYYAHH